MQSLSQRLFVAKMARIEYSKFRLWHRLCVFKWKIFVKFHRKIFCAEFFHTWLMPTMTLPDYMPCYWLHAVPSYKIVHYVFYINPASFLPPFSDRFGCGLLKSVCVTNRKKIVLILRLFFHLNCTHWIKWFSNAHVYNCDYISYGIWQLPNILFRNATNFRINKSIEFGTNTHWFQNNLIQMLKLFWLNKTKFSFSELFLFSHLNFTFFFHVEFYCCCGTLDLVEN